MKNFWKKNLPAAALAILVTLAGCESTLAPDAVEQLRPEAASLARGADKAKVGQPKGRVKIKGSKKNGEYAEWILAFGQSPLDESKQDGELVDGTREVVLRAAGHKLIIPRGAVDQPTWFKIKANGKKDSDDRNLEGVTVSLTAERMLPDGTIVSVGEHGFLAPVILEMSTRWAEKPVDAGIPTVIWLKKVDEGVETDVESRDGDKVRVRLDHFSDYGLAWPSRNAL